jgi:hypothetical protein
VFGDIQQSWALHSLSQMVGPFSICFSHITPPPSAHTDTTMHALASVLICSGWRQPSARCRCRC